MSGPLNGSRKQVLKSTFFIPRHECLMDTYRRFRLLRSQFWQKCTHFNSSFCTYFLFNKKIYLWLSLLIMNHLAPQKAFPLFLHYVQVCLSSLHPFLVLSLFLPPTPVIRRIENQRRGNFQTNLSDTENICCCAVRTLLLPWDPRALTSLICLIFANFSNCLRDQLQRQTDQVTSEV